MATSGQTSKVAIVALAIVSIVALLQLPTSSAAPAPQQPDPWNASSFQGAWCAQGDRTKQCSISANGAFANLTNESGSTSSGHFGAMGQNVITADQWNFVQGTLSQDGQRINWSNGTYWARCSSGGGGRPPNLDGTWYRDGNRSLSCSIRQRRKNIRLTNETGQTASGTIDGRRRVTTNWSGTTIAGTISSDGNTINWNNGTSWSR